LGRSAGAHGLPGKRLPRRGDNPRGGAPTDAGGGARRAPDQNPAGGCGAPPEPSGFTNKGLAGETTPPLLDRSSPLRSAHLRDPVGPQIHFASESFMDEVAAALNLDPIEFRLRHIKDPRDIALIKAAAEKSGWQTRPSPRRDQTGSKVAG